MTSTPRPNTGSGNAEFYAVLWRVARVRPCEGWDTLLYVDDHDGGPDGLGPDRFARAPAYGCFEAVVGTTVRFDFLLGVYHATWAGGQAAAIAREVQHIDAVFEAMAQTRPEENDLLFAGDFNLVPDRLASVVAAADRTSGTGSTLNRQGDRTQNLYDHLLVFDESATAELQGDATVRDVRTRTATPQAFYRTVSDPGPT